MAIRWAGLLGNPEPFPPDDPPRPPPPAMPIIDVPYLDYVLGGNYYRVPQVRLQYVDMADTILGYANGARAAQPPEIKHVKPEMTYIERVKNDLVHGRDEARAESLLLDRLTPSQQDTYTNHHFFDLNSNTGRLWRINCTSGFTGNVYGYDPVMDAWRSFCIHLVTLQWGSCQTTYWPLADHWLAQAMLLATDEKKFLMTAIGLERWWH